MTQEFPAMNTPTAVEFLDLEDVNEEQKQWIQNILYGQTEGSQASVEFPWDSGIEWSNVESSTEDEGFVNDPQEYVGSTPLPSMAGVSDMYQGGALVQGHDALTHPQVVCLPPNCAIPPPPIHGSIPILPVPDAAVLPPLLHPIPNQEMYTLHQNVKPTHIYPDRGEGPDKRRMKKKRSPECFDKGHHQRGGMMEMTGHIDDKHQQVMHPHPHLQPQPHMNPCPLTSSVSMTNTVSQTIPQSMGPMAWPAMHPPHPYSVPQLYTTSPTMVYGHPGHPYIMPNLYPYPNYASPPGTMIVTSEQAMQSPPMQMHPVGLMSPSEMPLQDQRHEPAVLAQVYEHKPAQSQVPTENSYAAPQDKIMSTIEFSANKEPVVFSNFDDSESCQIAADSVAINFEPTEDSGDYEPTGDYELSEEVRVDDDTRMLSKDSHDHDTSSVALSEMKSNTVGVLPGEEMLPANHIEKMQAEVCVTKKDPLPPVAPEPDVRLGSSPPCSHQSTPPRSWASLLKTSGAASSGPDLKVKLEPEAQDFRTSNSVNNTCVQEEDNEQASSTVAKNDVPLGLGELLSTIDLDHHSVHVLPRGLHNRGNWCYINATLQALLACPPFFNLMRRLPVVAGLKKGNSSIPIIDAMVEFVHEFSLLTNSQRMSKNIAKASPKQKDDILVGSPFEPTYVYNMLRSAKSDSFKGRQEDAEEFLSCILNALHEEMLELMPSCASKNNKMKNGDVAPNGDLNYMCDDNAGDEASDWQVMGHKNKSCVMRSVHSSPSPILQIFGGQMCSVLQQAGSSKSATVQPFFTLQLDIQADSVLCIKSALEGLVTKEAVHGFTSSSTKQEVEASRRITLETLPQVLVLHLKRFVYDRSGGCKKLMKKIDFNFELELSKDLLRSSAKLNPKQRKYRLFAVVYHDSIEAVKGHYITDAYHSGYDCWIRADDANVKRIADSQVLKHSPPRVPYLLYYRRGDTIVE